MEKNDGRFKKGQKMTPEQKIKAIKSMREAWKKRDSYRGDIKLSPLFNSWRAIRFTQKGKSVGNSPEWDDYKVFYNDMVMSYFDKCRLARLDKTKPFSKENCLWVNEKEAALLKRSALVMEYNGETKTLSEWASLYNIPYNALRQRHSKSKNYSPEEIIFGRMRKDKNAMRSVHQIKKDEIYTKASKMVSAYRCRDKKKGVSCDITPHWFIENILKKECSYCGDIHNVGCDRLDNSKGHIMSNVVPCCYRCNVIRSDFFTFDEMKLIGTFTKSIIDKRIPADKKEPITITVE